MEKAYKYRLYPNKKQEEQINKTFNCVRFVYNYYLAKRRDLYNNEKISLTYFKCCKDLTKLKKENVWLYEVDNSALQRSLRDLDAAYVRFFKHESANYPKFKSKKKHKHSYTTAFTKDNIKYCGKHIKLPKLGLVKTRDKRAPQGRIVNATITKTSSGKYFVSLCCVDVPEINLEKTGNKIGLDLGIKSFCTTSNGDVIENPSYYERSYKKLAALHRALDRKPRPSKNKERIRIRLAKEYEKITNRRNDYLQKLSTEMIRNNDVICIETLAVRDMASNHKMSRSIYDVSWSRFTFALEYKSKWYGRKLVKVNRYYASSQKCSVCGYKEKKVKKLSVRFWTCPKCNTSHDRDVNASINILNKGLQMIKK